MRIVSCIGSDFRYCLYSEDIVGYDKRLHEGYGVVVYNPIEVFETYNPFIKFYDDKIDEGYHFDYENPFKMSKVSENLLMVIRGFLLINENIGDFGIKKMSEFVKRNYVNGGTITFEEVESIIKRCSKDDNYKILKRDYPGKFIDKFVFYSKDCPFSKKERVDITNREKMYIIKRDRRKLIDTSISVLSSTDVLTMITNKRIGGVTGLKKDTIRRTLSARQRIKIRKLNLNRYFTQEKVSEKFRRFVDEYDRFKKMPISEVNKELEISHSYYYKFLKIIELNK